MILPPPSREQVRDAVLDGLAQDRHATALERQRSALALRASIGALLAAREAPEAVPAIVGPLEHSPEAVLETFRRRAPAAFAAWMLAFEENKAEYAVADRRHASLSVASNPGAEAFAQWVRPWLRGRVLDIGCGPQPVPVYLESYPPRRCAGIDPLPPHEEHPFIFRRAFCESIPWPDGCFETVTCATSLDHVFDLDRALDDIRRVLVPGGILLLWVGFVEGAAAYDVDRVSDRLDRFHLFHFDRPWFYPMVLRRFEILEDWAFDSQSHFLCLRPMCGDR